MIEIGSNDGIMLKFFKNRHKILGIDPATNVVLRSIKNGIPAIPMFFNSMVAKFLMNGGKLIYLWK